MNAQAVFTTSFAKNTSPDHVVVRDRATQHEEHRKQAQGRKHRMKAHGQKGRHGHNAAEHDRGDDTATEHLRTVRDELPRTDLAQHDTVDHDDEQEDEQREKN